MNDAIQLEDQYGAHNYAPLPVTLTRGEGVYLWDVNGKRYLDMMSAYSAVCHGHCNRRIIDAAIQQLNTLGVVSRAFYTDKLGAFLQKLCAISKQDMALPMNTGAEAVETAMKAARKWGYKIKGVAENQAEILCCDGNFHGRTIAIVGMSSEAQYQDGFGPFPDGLRRIPFNDADALEQAITPNTVAFLVEPIQGEGGINIPADGYLRACQDICKRHNVLLICDEIQTGLGRTGTLFAYQHDGVQPDGLIVGKALGGGVYPVSAFLANKAVMQVFTPGDHGSTFGGNPIAASVGLAALAILEEEKLVERSAQLGAYFMRELRSINSRYIKDIRGRGLFIGVEIAPAKATARDICERLMTQGLLSKETHETVVRFAPPLTIEQAQIDEAMEMIRQVLSD